MVTSSNARRQELTRRRAASWESIGEIAATGDARPWVRQVARLSPFSSSGMSMPSPGFVAALKSMTLDEREIAAVALTAAKNQYQQMSDFLSAVGIPAFLGMLALYSVDDDIGSWLVSIMLAAIVVYIVMFTVYRVLAAIAATAVESLHLVLVELAQHRD